ncbi:hypothetical protein HWV62_24558 [Athelia sp. TMB]|nr:hypothetical protein HWV62_24558 [Athelia sp. TMB]
MVPSRPPYHGTERKLVLAMDIGTTFSGISYSILDPGEIPVIKGVTRFPAQEGVGGDSKIPSILYYDMQGQVRAVGAEALQESIIEQAEDNGWMKVEWWKLHLRPKRLASAHVTDSDLPPLPTNKTAVEVLSDFMKYLQHCAQTFIAETHSESTWKSIETNIDFVLTHPNGWEGAQQSEIRRAAVLAGFVTDTLEGQSRIQLLTEGEASLHYCIGNGVTSQATMNGQGIIIVDAGGGTIDLSAYSVTGASGSFGEIAPTESKLANSKFGSPEELKHMVDCFDKSTKLRFRNLDEPSYIKFGGVRDKDPAAGIRSGQLKLPGSEVAALFEPSINSIIEAIEQQRRVAAKAIKSIFLVGGFAASDWLFSRLREHMTAQGIDFLRPDSHVNKAVADGALSFYLDHKVSSRVASKTFGVEIITRFDPHNRDHDCRSSKIFIDPTGEEYIPDVFDTILPKGTCVQEEKEFRRDYSQYVYDRSSLDTMCEDIYGYHGRNEPAWMDVERVEADTSRLAQSLEPHRGRDNLIFYRMDYSIVLLFGLTELKAQVCWLENGIEKRGPAKVAYDIESTIADI